MMRAIVILWLLTAGLGAPAFAHPVAQGALLVEVQPERLLLHLHVSTEQIAIANAFSTTEQAADEASLLANHGRYLLHHVRLHLDKEQLPLTLLRAPNHLSSAQVEYVFAAPIPAAPEQMISIEQDVLNEYEFAPGNPWEATYVTRVERGGEVLATGLLTRLAPLSFSVEFGAAAPSAAGYSLFADYLKLGVMHILTGYDHILFICAVMLAALTLWDVIKIVTVFTLAHSITLTLSVLDIFRLSDRIVEPTIAATIVIIALWNLISPDNARGHGRLWVTFAFGLFHGLGFAGGLLEAIQGLPGIGVGLAIVAFSIGVEAGHQVIVLPLFAGLVRLRDQRGGIEARSRRQMQALTAGSAVVLIGGVFYLVNAVRSVL